MQADQGDGKAMLRRVRYQTDDRAEKGYHARVACRTCNRPFQPQALTRSGLIAPANKRTCRHLYRLVWR